ncbi:ATP-dependent RNA helicase SUPV3L1, mitochondrial-like isoform X2 [Tubulanus polymorphus]|uniref:ATP-dependent RNA helicase SUPV3L1, mitochondrial-like isoform X2 n=1 Tax=Tubulanus polymorphus TaxID=672921 RepID=UPI003DA3DF07
MAAPMHTMKNRKFIIKSSLLTLTQGRVFSVLTSAVKLRPRNCHLCSVNKHVGPSQISRRTVRYKSESKDVNSLFQPAPFSAQQSVTDVEVGADLAGPLKKDQLLRLLNQFYRRTEVKKLAAECGLDNRLFHQAYISFRKYCVEMEGLPAALHVTLSDIIQGAGHVDDIFPYFLQHAKHIYPHLECMDDLRKISDLRHPANWYPDARQKQRKIIFHSGPTNSGKTYHALQRFMNAKSGVYCGPLKLLASEVFHKANAAGTLCDLVTGEERIYADPEGNASPHVACTVEMCSVITPYDVAVIDEIQMVNERQRGWAWTRALLGVCADEIHVCGEGTAIDLVKELMMATGDHVEVRRYKRLTKLTYLDKALLNFDNVRPGDCFVCFSKNDIYHISRQLEKRGHQCAVIYGGLPPGTKLAQAQKFNDPNDPCKIMVATDAIGMGLNLSIKRVIFYSLIKPKINEKGDKEMDLISTSQALQIGGRAGRYRTHFQDGEVTTFRREDIHLLHDLTNRIVEPLEQAGLHPTAEQIELFAYHLPNATLSNLIDIFVTLSQLDNDTYFMCNIDDFKFLADMIEHVPLALRVRYVFCCSPIPKKQPFVCTMFLRFARQFSQGEPLTYDWLCRQVNWPFNTPVTITDLVHLEGVFDVMDLYLWLSYRFSDMFPDTDHVREMQKQLDNIIQEGVINITKLLKKGNTLTQSAASIDSTELTSTDNRKSNASKAGYLRKRDKTLYGGGERLRIVKSEHDDVNGSVYSSRLQRGDVGKGRLTDRLLKEGLLTHEMIEKLRAEWTQDKQTSISSAADSDSISDSERLHDNWKSDDR